MSHGGALWRTACDLNARAALAKPLPPLFFLTDPARTPDPVAIAARLPSGAGVILRAFGAPDAREIGRALRAVADSRGLCLLVGADPDLAEDCGADGVHLPERALGEAAALRRRRPEWRLTGAAHGAEALGRAAAGGLDAAFLSPVFPSASPSAGDPLGVDRFSALAQAAGLPVYALGGVTALTVEALRGSGAVGVGLVEAIGDALERL